MISATKKKMKKKDMTPREREVHKRAKSHYGRGPANKTRGVKDKDKKLKATIKEQEERYKTAAVQATRE